MFLLGVVAVAAVMPGLRFLLGRRAAGLNEAIVRRWNGAVCRILGVRLHIDGSPDPAARLAVLGSGAYDFLIDVNRWFNHARRVLGFPYWSMSAYIKHKVKNAVSFIFDFEQALIHAAHEQSLDGVVCGHIHHATIHAAGQGVLYANCGDWVESCTALAEDFAGNLSIIRWVEESAQLLEESTLETCPDHGRLVAAN
jgi:hypothetical protein